jgi:hypothetical protein
MTDIGMDFNTLKPKISLLLDTNDKDTINKLKNEDKLNIEIKKWRKKRSLDSNAYMWLLAEKIAQKIGTTKIEVYREAIREVGQCEVLPIKNEAVETFINAWQHNGQGWICEIIGKSKIEGYTNVTAYYGSSVYDSMSMSRLVDLIVQEAKQLEIETLPPAELESLKNSWK